VIYFCSRKQRRAAVLASPLLNGIDYLEVPGNPGCGTQLAVTFLKDARRLALTAENLVVSGTTPVRVVSLTPPGDGNPLVLMVQLDQTGDFSTYTLTVVAGADITDPPDGMDPQLSSVQFSFKAGCPSPADCRPDSCCPPPARPVPDINYLAKDYEAFRQVMLDRIAVLVPTWAETHAADMGVALVEALAYAADHLSYQQDAVGTEAYIGTARSRISMRRHARLVDYRLSEGCNARTWVYLEAITDQVVVPKGTPFYVRTAGLPAVVSPLDPRVRNLLTSTQPIFESLQSATLFTELNQMDFYTWGDSDCCLPAGATEATLVGHLTRLSPGSVLVFEEVAGPSSGSPDDADPTHRWAVRLTGVWTNDHRQRPLTDPLTGQWVTRIQWSADDALPFSLCISSTSDALHQSTAVPIVSVARGNIVPADHGTWIENESVGTVPPAPPAPEITASCNCGTPTPLPAALPRFYPQLARSPLTFSVPYDCKSSAHAFIAPDAASAVPLITAQSDDGRIWTPIGDLLSSTDAKPLFVPEIEVDESVFLRFGDGTYGMAPDTGLSFTTTYRVGNGVMGNIGRDTLAHVVFKPNAIRSVRNPVAVSGGVDPESMEHARQWAPFAFQSQKRCVTEDDYARMTPVPGEIREARGTLRWTGSWYSVFVSVEAVRTLTPRLIQDTTRRLNLLRMMGIDLAVEGAIIVGLTIRMRICVAPDHFAGDVYTSLMKVFVSGDQCSGGSGLLNASNFSFGATVYASPLIAAAQAVPGVLTASLATFARMDDPSVDGMAKGYLTMGRLELPRCDNDPNHLDHGLFALHLDGGK
jgi:hypothetical protein